MAKTKTVYICQNCGANSPKWIGKCNSCGEWNTFVEEKVTSGNTVKQQKITPPKVPVPINKVSLSEDERIDTTCSELNRVLGGGLVYGSLVLIGGEPGIGKSTLLLQIALNINRKVLYVSGEESARQIRLRAERLEIKNDNCYILTETLYENILPEIESNKPDILIIDSIQTLYTEKLESSPGSISQIRECTTELLKFAKETNTPVFIIGHINKDGNIAGPKVLEHIVDTVLQFEGDTNYMYRILRATKNRFGSASELGIYEMFGKGLRQVKNPSELFLSKYSEGFSGSVVAATIEGIRPFIIEVQALVSTAAYGTPQRSATGFDTKRLNMLLAVLEKRAGFRISSKDVFLNIAGGIKVYDPAIDIAVICAVLSSDQDIALPKNICFSGEVGLSGEIRAVNRIEQRIGEAERLGFEKIYISKSNKSSLTNNNNKIEIKFVEKVEEVFMDIFG